MKENKTLLSYILGACTIIVFLPIMEELVNVILSWIEYLKIISYFRLANYWKPMESDKVNYVFKPKNKFENVVTLYNFDKELRTHIFSAIQSIEIPAA